ncbi:ATP-binding protein [Schleiferia thermophila]
MSLHLIQPLDYILIAEDSVVQAKKLQKLLEDYKLNSLVCKNGKEALEQAEKKKPILIISDVVMPVMDGYTLCKNIKSNASLRDTPFMILTSLSDPLDIIKGLQAGADNFLTKPYEEKYLLSRINYLLTNKMIRDASNVDVNMEIVFQNQKFIINSDKKQILDLLLSVYEAAMVRNSQLQVAQRQLQILNEELKQANSELESFAHAVSHDLKTPLKGIQGIYELFVEEYGNTLDEKAMEYLHWIKVATNNMSDLIKDLLNFSKSSRANLYPEEVHLSQMAEQVIKELRMTNFKANHQIHIQPDIKVYADPSMMRIVLTNLLSNALKYSQKVDNPTIYFGKTSYHGREILYVKDNGAGFSMEKATQLFKPFTRLHSESEFQGTGIGLSTVKRIIDRHNGEIWCESEPGKGAVFYFTLNLDPAHQSDSETTGETPVN